MSNKIKIAIPYNDKKFHYQRWYDGPNQLFLFFLDAFWNHNGNPDIEIVKMSIDDLIHRQDYNVVFLFRCIGAEEEYLCHYKRNGILVCLWHDDLHAFKYRIPFASRGLAKLFDISDILFLPYLHHFNLWKVYRPYRDKVVWLPWSVPDWIFEHSLPWSERKERILLSGHNSFQYPLRTRIFKYAGHKDSVVDTIDHPGYRLDRNKKSYTGRNYYELLGTYKAAVATTPSLISGLRSKINYTVAKYFEIPACGCLPLMEVTPDLRELGFTDSENCVYINRWNYKKKFQIINSHEAKIIAGKAQSFIKEKHIHSIRVQTVISEIVKRFK